MMGEFSPSFLFMTSLHFVFLWPWTPRDGRQEARFL